MRSFWVLFRCMTGTGAQISTFILRATSSHTTTIYTNLETMCKRERMIHAIRIFTFLHELHVFFAVLVDGNAFYCKSQTKQDFSDTHCFEGPEKISGWERVMFGPKVHVCDEIVWNVTRNCQLFIACLKSPVKGLYNLLVEFETHRWLEIGQDVHLCKKRQCH